MLQTKLNDPMLPKPNTASSSAIFISQIQEQLQILSLDLLNLSESNTSLFGFRTFSLFYFIYII
jgi:hypothetical protein